MNISSLVKKYLDSREDKYFEDLLDKFKPLINSYARKLYYLEYEDSFQELSLALYEAVITIKDYSNEYSCISYIQKSIVNRFTKLYHKSKEAQQIQFLNTEFDNCKEYECTYIKPEDYITKLDLENCINRKSLLERKIIYRVLQGYSDKEIGQDLGYTRQYINKLKKKIFKDDV